MKASSILVALLGAVLVGVCLQVFMFIFSMILFTEPTGPTESVIRLAISVAAGVFVFGWILLSQRKVESRK